MTKLSQLPPDTGPTTNDILAGVDLNSNVTKKITIADLISLIFNNIPTTAVTAMSNPYKFSARIGTNYASGTGGFSTAHMDTEIYDTNNNYNPATYTYTVPVSGFYHFSGSVTYLSSGTSEIRIAGIFVNGIEKIRGQESAAPSAMNFTAIFSGDVQLNAGDTVVMYAYSVNNRTIAAGENSKFSGHLISRT